MYKAPRDKLVCILNCCKVINNLLLNASLASNKDHPGADEFLPVLIYVTIKVIMCVFTLLLWRIGLLRYHLLLSFEITIRFTAVVNTRFLSFFYAWCSNLTKQVSEFHNFIWMCILLSSRHTDELQLPDKWNAYSVKAFHISN